MPDFKEFGLALGEGSLNLSEGDTVTGYIGLQVPDAVEASEVRFAGLGGGEPFIWKVKQPRTPLCDDPCIGVDYSLACSRSMWSMSACTGESHRRASATRWSAG